MLQLREDVTSAPQVCKYNVRNRCQARWPSGIISLAALDQAGQMHLTQKTYLQLLPTWVLKV